MDVADAIPINWAIIKNPINWVILFLMVFIATFAIHIVLGQKNGVSPTASS